jgi:TetR/AcrR family transcriptional regulator
VKLRPGSRGKPEETRAAILHAAMHEFAEVGLAGARTGSIARAAGVNKALIHYYFKDKETLYTAALDHVFSGVSKRLLEVFERKTSPREKILGYVAAHFDFIASEPTYPRVVQREMMASPRTRSRHVVRILELYFRPVLAKVIATLEEGMRAGEFRKVDAAHFAISMAAATVFYFSNAGIMGVLLGGDPLSSRRVAERRAAVLDQVSAALAPQRSSAVKVRRQKAGSR